MKAFWEILRPLNCAMAGAAAVIGLLLAAGFYSMAGALVFLAVFLITGAGNAVNDYYDREIDTINRPGRPIPGSRISPRTALSYSILLFAAGCILAALASPLCLAVAVFNSALLFFYARSLKATLLAGNICVAYLTGSTFLFGGTVYGAQGLQANLIPFLLSSLATMSREIMKDVEDMAGDRQGGAATLPILAGERTSGALAAACAMAAVALSFAAPFGRIYIMIVAVADLFFLISMEKIARGDAAGSQKALKAGMAVALLAFMAGALQQWDFLKV